MMPNRAVFGAVSEGAIRTRCRNGAMQNVRQSFRLQYIWNGMQRYNRQINAACGDGYSGPVVADSFSVAEVSKQDICVPRKCRESHCALLTGFLLRWLPAP